MLFAIFFSAQIFAAYTETLTAEGNSGENISWKIYNLNPVTSTNPYYKLVFEGSGTLVGYTYEGKTLGYGNANKSQFGEWMDYIYEISVGDGIEAIGTGGLGFL